MQYVLDIIRWLLMYSSILYGLLALFGADCPILKLTTEQRKLNASIACGFFLFAICLAVCK